MLPLKVPGDPYSSLVLPTAIPNGGATGQLLTKNSGADGDIGWKSLKQSQLPTIIDCGSF